METRRVFDDRNTPRSCSVRICCRLVCELGTKPTIRELHPTTIRQTAVIPVPWSGDLRKISAERHTLVGRSGVDGAFLTAWGHVALSQRCASPFVVLGRDRARINALFIRIT